MIAKTTHVPIGSTWRSRRGGESVGLRAKVVEVGPNWIKVHYLPPLPKLRDGSDATWELSSTEHWNEIWELDGN